MLREILEQGSKAGVFRIKNAQWTAMMMLYALKGLEAPYLNNSIGSYIKEHRDDIMNVLFSGLLTR